MKDPSRVSTLTDKSEAKILLIKDLSKRVAAIDVAGDPAFAQKMTANARRFWRQHRMLYCRRVFSHPSDKTADVGWHVPQWIGTAATNSQYALQYPLRGFYLPNDEEAIQYYGQRRSEANDPAIVDASTSKASPASSSTNSPLHPGCPRSKMGASPTSMSRSASQDSMWSSWSTQVARQGTICNRKAPPP
jgi:hypothetical protein